MVVEAFQWRENMRIGDCPQWFVDAVTRGDVHFKGKSAFLHTLGGPIRTNDGDWVIKGVHNELYPCTPDIFAETYDPD